MLIVSYTVMVSAGTNLTAVYADGGPGSGTHLPVQSAWQDVVDDKLASGWFYDAAQLTLWLKLSSNYKSALIVTDGFHNNLN